MPRKRSLIASEWMTLDGVFDADTMSTWFEPYQSDERIAYIKEGVFEPDAILAGRVTYEMFEAYWPKQKNDEMGIADRMNSMPKYVVSSTLKEAKWNNSTIIKGGVMEKILDLKQQPGKDIIVFGSAALVHSLMKANLVDEFRFLVHPIVMGKGKRFFTDGMPTTKLELARTKTFKSGVTLLVYHPAR